MKQSACRLLATADLHYSLHSDGDASTKALAERVCASDAHAFIIAGDVAGANLADFEECLRLFDSFAGRKLLVPGNHDIWTRSGSSRDKYESDLPRAAGNCGFHMLDSGPVLLGGTAFVGTIAWYDYSMRNPSLGLSKDDYSRKTFGRMKWNDGVYVRWDLRDEEFVDVTLGRLEEHYRQVEGQAKRVVAVLHHLPFSELLYGPASRPLEFCRAYMGSERFGRLLARLPKLSHAICGHRHGPAVFGQEGLTSFVVGSEYGLKRLLELDLESGHHAHHSMPAATVQQEV